MSQKVAKQRKPMRDEAWFFLGLVGFFVGIAILYGLWSREPAGTTALALLAGLCGFAGGYLYKLSNEVDPRPEDDPYAEIADAAGDYGRFSPHSWWPLVCGIAVTLIFLGPALHQWWIFGLGAVVGVIGLVGQVFEFSRGQHAH